MGWGSIPIPSYDGEGAAGGIPPQKNYIFYFLNFKLINFWKEFEIENITFSIFKF